MTILIDYAYNTEPTDEKVYGIVENTDKNIWLVSTVTKGDYLNWQLLKSFDQSAVPNDFSLFTGEMYVKDNKIYILNRLPRSAFLFIIPIKDIGTIDDMAQYKYNLPEATWHGLSIYQNESILIQPTVNGADLYICAVNSILLSKDDKRDDWSIFHEFDADDSLVMIKTSKDIMAVVAENMGGALYLAPLGSTNFQRFELYDSEGNEGVFTVFFHMANTTGLKIMTTLDLGGSVRTFTYKVGPDGIITLTPADIKGYDVVIEKVFPLGTLAAATQFGNKVRIGMMGSHPFGADVNYDFCDIIIAQDAKIAIKPSVVIHQGDEKAFVRYKLNRDGPTLYLDTHGNFYVSSDGGVNWQLVQIVLHPATN